MSCLQGNTAPFMLYLHAVNISAVQADRPADWAAEEGNVNDAMEEQAEQLTRQLRANQEECNRLQKILMPLENDHSAYAPPACMLVTGHEVVQSSCCSMACYFRGTSVSWHVQ